MFNVTNDVKECAIFERGSNFQGWVLAIASGLACCLGATVVFSDIFLQRFSCVRYVRITQNTNFLVASLSLGAGVMLFSSFFTLMRKSRESFDLAELSRGYSGLYLLIFYFIGVLGSAFINSLIHYFVSDDSMLHHHHHHDTHHLSHFNHHHHPNNNHSPPEETIVVYDEHSPLLLNKDDPSNNNNKNNNNNNNNNNNKNNNNNNDSSSNNNNNNSSNNNNNNISGSNDGKECEVNIVDSDKVDPKAHLPISFYDNQDPTIEQHQQQQQNEDQEKLMRIGIQTALAISIHKFPEGLITFVTSKVSPSLGFTLFFAIALHNISEGVTIALPLYMATKSRAKSFFYTTLLGGLSQPLGALIGWLFLRQSDQECWDHDFVYGALFGSVSGLMSVICIQGMLPQAIKCDKTDGNIVSTFFFLGVFIMCLSTALFDHAKSSVPSI